MIHGFHKKELGELKLHVFINAFFGYLYYLINEMVMKFLCFWICDASSVKAQ